MDLNQDVNRNEGIQHLFKQRNLVLDKRLKINHFLI